MKVIIVKNEELSEPFCYEGLDENGDWYCLEMIGDPSYPSARFG